MVLATFSFQDLPRHLELPCEVSNLLVSFCRGTHWDFGSNCSESVDPFRDGQLLHSIAFGPFM